MNKKVFQIMGVIVVLALTFGSFVSVNAAPQSAATTYYVATTGNDANAGTSAAPFKTIQKCANVAGSGSICSVAAGTYAERVSATRAGIVFQGNGLVTMQGFQISADNMSVKGFYMTGMASTLVGVDISAKTCVIENNHVYYAPRGGISLASSSSGCVVRNNKLEKNSQWGLSVDGTNHTIEGNEIWNTIQYHPQWTNPPSWVDADGIRFFGTGHVIRNNYIHDIKFDEVYNKTAHIDCFQTWTSGTANILFEGNKCEEMYIHLESASGSYMKAQGFMIEGGAHDITIRNNVINAYRSINLGDPGDTVTTNNINILNNTFVGGIPVQLAKEEYGVFVTKATTVTAKNNIFYNILGPSFVGTVNASYNLLYRADGKALDGSAKTGDLWNVNPLLTTDYQLTASSPARGKAEGGGDMGAYPYGGAPLATATVMSTATPLNTPVVTITPTATALTPTASPVVVSPTPTASAVPASPTATLLSNPTASAVPASSTPTVSSVPASSTPTASISARGSQRILQPTILDCKNGTVADIRIENTHDVTIKNCNVVIISGNGIQITDSYNIIVDNVDISNTYAEGSGINLESTTSGSTHNITIQNFHIHGAMGWGIAGSNAVLKDITVRNGLIEDIGKAGGSQKHGLYINNWQTFLVEDVTVLRSWNTGVKIVGDTTDGILRRVVVKDSGRAGSSGPGISLGDSRVSHMARLTFEYCNIQNSINPAIWVLDTVNGANYITVDHCYFKNNYYAVQIPKGAIGWKVTNNVGYNQATYSVARPPLQFEGGDADVAANYFDYNNWYFDGNNPVRVSGTTLSFPQWQAKGVDQHGMSVNPGSVTATPSVVPAFTSTLKAASPTPTASVPTASTTSTVPTASSIPASATPVPASPTPTASSIPASATPVPASPTPTASSIPVLATPTASPVPALPTPTSQPAVPPTSTPPVDRQTSEKVYDDKDGGFVYSAGWQDVTNKRAYGGSYKQTNIKDSSVTFTFTGQSFSVMYTSGPAFRKMDVYVDGLLVGSINEKGRTNFQKRWDYSDQLTSGSHTLKLVFVGSAGTSATVDAVIVR